MAWDWGFAGGEPELVRTAVVHYQFEAIHPLNDGNGRLGRLLISLYLRSKGLLDHPFLNLSEQLEENGDEYRDRLREVDKRKDWDGWVLFFLSAIIRRATMRRIFLRQLADLYLDVRKKLESASESGTVLRAVDLVFERIVVTAKTIEEKLEISAPYSYKIIRRLEKHGLLKRSRRHSWPQLYNSPSLLEFWQKA